MCAPCHGEACAEYVRGGVVDDAVGGLDVMSLFDPVVEFTETGEAQWVRQSLTHRCNDMWWQRGGGAGGVAQPEQGCHSTTLI